MRQNKKSAFPACFSEQLQQLPSAVPLCITGAHTFAVGESLSFMSHSFAVCLAETFLIIFPEVTALGCMMNPCPYEDNVRFLFCVIMILFCVIMEPELLPRDEVVTNKTNPTIAELEKTTVVTF